MNKVSELLLLLLLLLFVLVDWLVCVVGVVVVELLFFPSLSVCLFVFF